MEKKEIQLRDYYVDLQEKWIPFEVMRMRFEDAFADLTEDEIITLRKTKARWFYHTKLNKTYLEAHLAEHDFGVQEDYRMILKEKTKVLVLKKPKEEKKVLTAIQKVQLFNKENAPIRTAHRLYFSMRKNDGIGQFAYLLLNEKGEIIEKKHVLETVQPHYKGLFILQVMHHLLKIAPLRDVKKLMIHTHHRDYRMIISKLNSLGKGKKTEKIKTGYKELCVLIQQYDYFKYEIIRKEKNKEAVALLGKNQVFNVVKKEVTHAVVKKEVTHAYVDASVRFQKKEAYIAGVLKNKQGITMMSFSKPCAYSQNITRVELEAAIEMMKQATEAGCTPVIIHTDSQGVYEFFQGAVKKVRKRNEKIHALVKQAKKQYPQCTVAKIPRTHNKEAHNLAISAKGTVKVHIN